MFILIFEQLMKMFFILLLAFICYRRGLVDQNGNKTVSNLLLLIVNPTLILTVYQMDFDPARADYVENRLDEIKSRLGR